jgi:hypothetical protein
LPEGDQKIVKVQEVSQVTREEILKDFTHAEQAVIMSVPAATNVEDLEHHLEEMMYHENCPRSVLVQLMDKFRMVLVKHEHEDPTVSMYFKGMQ